ncbi:MAG: asparagine synthase-related protein [Pseudomonadota bacterium]
MIHKAEPPLPGRTEHQLGVWRLETGPKLPVAITEFAQGSGHAAFMGVGVDRDGNVVTDHVLKAKVSALKTAEAVADYMAHCAGRYAFVIILDDVERLYLDPVGSLGAVYDANEGRVASTLNLVLHRPVIENQSYPLAALAAEDKARFAFGHTADQHVRRLLPNHYLDLTTFRETRHWPGEGDIIEPDEAQQTALVTGIVKRLEQIVAALANHTEPVYLPLSGGIDSRVLLACARPSLDRLTLFSHAENQQSRKDSRIATKLARRLGQNILISDPLRTDPDRVVDPAWLKRTDDAFRIATAKAALPSLRYELVWSLPPGGLLMRGNVVDFLKAVLWRKGTREYTNGTEHSINFGIKMMNLSGWDPLHAHPEIRAEYEAWLSSLDGMASKRIYDLSFTEHFLANGLGNTYYGHTNNFYICPFSDRTLLGAANSLPPDRRIDLEYTQAIIDWRLPEFSKTPFTRPASTQRVANLRAAERQIFTLAG